MKTREGALYEHVVHSTPCTVHEASHPRVVAHRPRRSKRAGPRRSAACRAAGCAAAAARQLSVSSTRSASTTLESGNSSNASPSSRSRKVRSPLPVTSKSWTSTSFGARSLNTERGDEEAQLRAMRSCDIPSDRPIASVRGAPSRREIGHPEGDNEPKEAGHSKTPRTALPSTDIRHNVPLLAMANST